MDTTSTMFMIGVIIIFGLLAQYNFKKTKMPDVLILIAVGALLSYFGFIDGFRKDSEEITFIITFSLIFVVFYGSFPIKLKALLSTMKYAFISSLLNFIIITVALGAVSHYLLGLRWILALSLGALFTVLDGSVINSILETIKVSPKAEAQIETESAIIDVLAIVGVLSMINFSEMAVNEMFQSLTSYLFLSLGIGIVAAIIWAFVLKHVGDYSSAPIATIAVLSSLYAFSEYVKANGVMTIFFFSIMLSNAAIWSSLFYKEEKESVALLGIEAKHFFKDISFLIRTFLFVYLGILIDFTQWVYLLYGLGFFLIAYLARSLIMNMTNNKNLQKKEMYLMEAMCMKGLTPAVMLAVIKADIMFTNIVVGGIFSSVIITSVLICLVDRNIFTSAGEIILKRIDLYRKTHKPLNEELKSILHAVTAPKDKT